MIQPVSLDLLPDTVFTLEPYGYFFLKDLEYFDAIPLTSPTRSIHC